MPWAVLLLARKLTLDQGLGADFRRRSAQIKSQSTQKKKGRERSLP